MREDCAHEGDVSHAVREPLVSIIIPAYKVAPFIKETLDSVFSQTFTDYEAIVINDGSPDTDELERGLEPYRERILYLKQENRGAGAARNAGLRAARGRFVAFLDGDDTYVPTFLSDQLQLIQSNGGYDLVYADAKNFGEFTPDGLTNMDVNQSRGEVDAEALISGRCNVITSAVLARRELILEVGLFDETLRNSQDFDLWIRLAKHGACFSYQRKVLVGRRIYAGSLASEPINSFAGEVRVLEKTSLREDLTGTERSALESTVMLRRAAIELIKAKRCLLEGDFNSASKSFQFANEQLRSWKLRLVLIWLRLAPGLLQRCYKLRPT
ncbi:MAG TPA: glycosyltransferase family 2 protein [Pyrinomonadaceae bacterium]|nr:glycosyltransferase family 2 protein [Pyrinomonadaceae bacterium]